MRPGRPDHEGPSIPFEPARPRMPRPLFERVSALGHVTGVSPHELIRAAVAEVTEREVANLPEDKRRTVEAIYEETLDTLEEENARRAERLRRETRELAEEIVSRFDRSQPTDSGS